MEAPAHTLLAPSAGARWSRCSMAPHEEAKYPEETTEASQLGTNAHAAWETWLSGGDPESHDFCDTEMVNNLTEGVQYLTNRCNKTGMKVCGIEEKVDVGVVLGFPEGVIKGTLDTRLASGTMVEIVDLKYGKTPVEPDHNEQLILYAGGALGNMLWFSSDDFPVRLTIFQPRGHDGQRVKCWDTTLGVIKKELTRLGAAARKCYDAPEFNPGEKQCQWCNARNDCQARKEHAMRMVEEQFLPLGMAMREGKDPTDEYLSSMMLKIPEIENVIKDIRKRAYERASAGNFPGWKLVRGRKSRKWTDAQEALSKVQRWRVDGKALGLDVARPRGELSPAQAEKIPGLSDKQKKVLAEMVSIEYGEPILVPAADSRPAVTLNAEKFFGEVKSDQ